WCFLRPSSGLYGRWFPRWFGFSCRLHHRIFGRRHHFGYLGSDLVVYSENNSCGSRRSSGLTPRTRLGVMYDGKMENLTPAQQAAQDERTEDDKRNGRFIAAERTNLPLNDFMTRLMAEEIPMLDSNSRGLVYKLLREYEGPEITTQDELPKEIRDIMDLY